ncbi:gamma-butyrobetaine hydroxylase-like domain-containing protein [Cupriavidus basilensis]
MLQTGKREVGIAAVEPVGNYAIQIRFKRRPRHRHLFPGNCCTASATSRKRCGPTISSAWKLPVSIATRPWRLPAAMAAAITTDLYLESEI